MKIQNSFIFRIAAEYCAFVHRASSMLVKCIYYILFLCEDYLIICGVEHTFFLLQISYIVQFKIIIQLTFLEILASVWGEGTLQIIKVNSCLEVQASMATNKDIVTMMMKLY